MSLSKYMKPRAVRREAQSSAGRFRGGKLTPVMATPYKGSESGVHSEVVHFELDPIPGRLLTSITAEVVSVFVPIAACHALKNPEADLPGNAEVIRQELLSGNALFGTETEGEISKRLGIMPRSVAGTKVVSELGRLAHNAAVNHLRLRKYVKAAQLDAANTSVTPALLDQTSLERMNGVLDPEDRINGAVNLEGEIPIRGIGHDGAAAYLTRAGVREYEGAVTGEYTDTNGTVFYLREDPDNPGHPKIFGELGSSGADIKLSDFYTAEKSDRLTREMRQIVDDNPVHGEQIVARYAHGLNVDLGRQPMVIYERRVKFGEDMVRGMDGPSLDVTQTNSAVSVPFTVPIPATEFGGIVITFAAVKPDEVIASQPHPILSKEWVQPNFVKDEMAVDPVPVRVRELYADCDVGDEETRVMYLGNNHLERMYLNYGFNRHLDQTTVENKSAIWQLAIPLSVTPSSVIYPESLSHYPFADQNAEVCTYNAEKVAVINTPTIFGPTPLEELAAIEDQDIFGDDDE
ncbi:hypothetical protein [Aliiroseovarius sp. 2305UL8-7]|uniref:hypothetical protein n=1 Tax=Aliiroseovarius conchicola TaxID=3121637 RepID=UPI003526DCCD